MGGASLPPGFRFHPTDDELVGYYLQRKVQGLEIELEVIPVIDLYKFDPWELPEKSFLPKRDMEWFFFCPRDRKYPNGSRTNRATKAGYWKATGKDRKISCQSGVTGYRKTLVFYRGRAPLGDRTCWIMHEYRLCDDLSQGSLNFQGAFALCRIVKKNEPGQKMNNSNDDPKCKSIVASSSNMDFTSTIMSNEPLSISRDVSSQASYQGNDSCFSSPNASPYQVMPMADFEPAPMEMNPSSIWVSPDLILDSSKDYPQLHETICEYFPQYAYPSSVASWQSHEHKECSPNASYSNLTGEMECVDNLSGFSYMPPGFELGNYMGVCGNGEMTYEGYDRTNSLKSL